ncbi:MAG: hypothetical protein Q8Q60_04665 [Candidatus Chromulinivorax sp.]|nr:hypothetical protein [Candidatus Chromulinivorax sp.]
MKKLIFLLLLAQTISFLYGDSACMGYRRYQGTEGTLSDPADTNAWRWGVKPLLKIRCDCPCMHYKQLANHKCITCGHTRVPEDLKLSSVSEIDAAPTTITITTVHHKKQTRAERKAEMEKSKEKKKEEKRRKKLAAKKKNNRKENRNKKLIAVTDE